MSGDEEAARPARPGTAADLSWRMDRLETNHESLSKEVGQLASTVARVELNQQHAEDLNKLRFTALDTSVAMIAADLKGFMARIDGIISGDVQTAQSRQGMAIIADFTKWRGEVNDRLEGIEDAPGRATAVNQNNRSLRQGAWVLIAALLSISSAIISSLIVTHRL